MERKLPEWMGKSKKTAAACEKQSVSDTPFLSFKGRIRFITEFCDCCYICEEMLQKLKTVKQLIVGFDMEWPRHCKPIQEFKSVKQGKTALIQMCPSAQVCYLFRVAGWKRLPKVFLKFLSHPKVQLVGLNVQCDLWKLGRDFEISVLSIIRNNTIELSSLANRIFSIKENWSLARLTLYVLKINVNKLSDIRISDWSQNNLAAEQLVYAATDAYVSLLVYQRLLEMNKEISMNASV